mmetsp:Transcript_32917/g.72486  ORF Transcript_32917/g.72486 Transcript_32917/m.72486 type:complete len:244 (-) Transcript_32917:1379-2110(-)
MACRQSASLNPIASKPSTIESLDTPLNSAIGSITAFLPFLFRAEGAGVGAGGVGAWGDEEVTVELELRDAAGLALAPPLDEGWALFWSCGGEGTDGVFSAFFLSFFFFLSEGLDATADTALMLAATLAASNSTSDSSLCLLLDSLSLLSLLSLPFALSPLAFSPLFSPLSAAASLRRLALNLSIATCNSCTSACACTLVPPDLSLYRANSSGVKRLSVAIVTTTLAPCRISSLTASRSRLSTA